ncbi:Bax inhibitor-1/YccA family protein [Yinghuangia seranimata]|uniref:Bax inhibitor-1/YccA family protein n=1 Tax=Yinghuangia seranimata TaxID=408067 RepID=UPI00248AF9EA|nr:Bax inhibitor-1/YccA family protein [Yinghuangia seranimata]MDI2128803.1 Bax inhibitor-1/YccA family protein [Yinghuangia seranimata]
MRSSNPVLTRRGAFGVPQAGPQQAPQYGAPNGQQPSGGNPFGGNAAQYGQQGQQYGQPTPEQMNQWYQQQSAGPLQTGRMTVDDVVAKTAITLLTLLVGAAIGWAFIPFENFMLAGVAALAAFGVYLALIIKRTISPALVVAYAALEGVFLGAVSHAFEYAYSGIVVQAVLGTAGVFAGMLWAYKSGRVRVTSRFARIGTAIAIGFFLVAMVNFLVWSFGGGNALGLNDGPLGILFSLLGIGVGAFFLAMDFHEVEQLSAAGAPEREAWRCAFGLTLSLVWIYTYLLRLLAILRD